MISPQHCLLRFSIWCMLRASCPKRVYRNCLLWTYKLLESTIYRFRIRLWDLYSIVSSFSLSLTYVLSLIFCMQAFIILGLVVSGKLQHLANTHYLFFFSQPSLLFLLSIVGASELPCLIKMFGFLLS